jgi:hypothetical protein
MLGVSRLLTGGVTEGEALRFGRDSGRLPSDLLHYSKDKKPVVVWTSTPTCNLRCAHCYTDSADAVYPDELTTEQAFAMVDDLFEVVAHARDQSMRAVVSTNGTLLTDEPGGRRCLLRRHQHRGLQGRRPQGRVALHPHPREPGRPPMALLSDGGTQCPTPLYLPPRPHRRPARKSEPPWTPFSSARTIWPSAASNWTS